MRKLLNGDYYNVGWWEGDICDPDQAAATLLARLIERDKARAQVSDVMDVGCGLGVGTAAIGAAYPGARVTGVNYSEKQVGYARARYATADVSFECADAVDLPFEAATFDRIYCVEAAMHFQTRAAFLHQAHRVLRPGGRVYLTDILCHRPNEVIPAANVVPDEAGYTQIVAGAGLELVALEDVSEQTIDGFKAHMGAVGQAPIARFFEAMCDSYVIVELRKPEL